MGPETLAFFGTIWSWISTAFTFLITEGTNEIIVKLFLMNALLWSIIVWLTPTKKDNKFLDWLTTTISNFKKPKEKDSSND